jgi:hypothetical protein
MSAGCSKSTGVKSVAAVQPPFLRIRIRLSLAAAIGPASPSNHGRRSGLANAASHDLLASLPHTLSESCDSSTPRHVIRVSTSTPLYCCSVPTLSTLKATLLRTKLFELAPFVRAGGERNLFRAVSLRAFFRRWLPL